MYNKHMIFRGSTNVPNKQKRLIPVGQIHINSTRNVIGAKTGGGVGWGRYIDGIN